MTEEFTIHDCYMTHAQVIDWLGFLPDHETRHMFAGVLHMFFDAGDSTGYYAIDDQFNDDSPIGRNPIERLIEKNGVATVRAEWLTDDDNVPVDYLPCDTFAAFGMQFEVLDRTSIADERLDEITIREL